MRKGRRRVLIAIAAVLVAVVAARAGIGLTPETEITVSGTVRRPRAS